MLSKLDITLRKKGPYKILANLLLDQTKKGYSVKQSISILVKVYVTLFKNTFCLQLSRYAGMTGGTVGFPCSNLFQT